MSGKWSVDHWFTGTEKGVLENKLTIGLYQISINLLIIDSEKLAEKARTQDLQNLDSLKFAPPVRKFWYSGLREHAHKQFFCSVFCSLYTNIFFIFHF